MSTPTQTATQVKTKTVSATKFAIAIVHFGLFVVFGLPQAVSADGMMIAPNYDGWYYAEENEQIAMIDYKNGIEELRIGVTANKDTDSSLVWLFPIPAVPDKIVIDVQEDLPRVYGSDVSEIVEGDMRKARKSMWATQIYLSPPYLLRSQFYRATAGFVEGDVLVYQQIKKLNLITEVITAQTNAGLVQYLRGLGMEIDLNALPVLAKYIGKNYSFVVSMVDKSGIVKQDDPEFKDNQVAVYVKFPTARIYYPLMPTSVYGNKIIPTTVTISGFVTPEVFDAIKTYTKVSYQRGMWNGESGHLTEIKIDAPANKLVEDLYVDSEAPRFVYYRAFMAGNTNWLGWVIFILSLFVAGMIAGGVVFRQRLMGWGLIGLSGLFTLPVLTAVVALSSTLHGTAVGSVSRGFRIKKNAAYILLLLGLFAVLFSMSVFIYCSLILGFGEVVGDADFLMSFLVIVMILLIPFICAFCFHHTRQKEMKTVEWLKNNGFSTWTIQPKDRRKIWFVAIYSVSFVLVTWLLTEFVVLIT